jgi:Escherichia/Staphylococcus phage prohead protease
MSTDARHSIPLAIKYSSASAAGEFIAYGSTFGGDPDAYLDIVANGAFAKTISEDPTPALLWAHDQTQPIGVIKRLVEDEHGLLVEGKLTLEVAKAAEAHALMKAGALAFSIGYRTIKSTALGKGVTRLDEIKLFEVSAVAIPANPNARLVAVKAQPDILDQSNPRVIEQILRDAGVARNQAKRIVSLGRAAFKQRDVVIADSKLANRILAASQAIRNSLKDE